MSGPCMCGDLYCPSCGSPEAAKVEAAEEWAIEMLHRANLAADEYRIAVQVGLVAVKHARRAAKEAFEAYAAAEHEERLLGGN